MPNRGDIKYIVMKALLSSAVLAKRLLPLLADTLAKMFYTVIFPGLPKLRFKKVTPNPDDINSFKPYLT